MRKNKQIGSSLEARVVLNIPRDFLVQLKCKPEDLLDDLRELFIVSQVELKAIDKGKWEVEVKKTNGEKCDRCWNYSEELNNQRICLKCINNIS